MTIKADCAACGRDCTNCNATYRDDIYCIGCLPSPKRMPKPMTPEEEGFEAAALMNADQNYE